MPQVQMVDFNPPERTTTTPFEKFLGSYAESATKRMDDDMDIQGLINVYKNHKQDGSNIDETLQSLQTTPGISPSKRISETQRLMKMREMNSHKQEAADKAVAQKLSAEQKLANKAVKNPLGGLSGQPISPEESTRIDQVIAENKEASADELAQAFGRANVAPANSKQYVESRRETDKTKSQRDIETQKLTHKEKIDFHKDSEKYDEEVRESATRARKQIEVVKDLTEAVDSGKVNPASIANIFKGYGKAGRKISEAFTNAEQGKFEAAMPFLLEGWKEVFGVRLSDADLKILENKLPSIGKSPSANKSILEIISKYAKPNILRAEIAKEIKSKNKGLRPINFADQVEEELNTHMESNALVPMRSPSGKIRMVPKATAAKMLSDPDSGWTGK